VQLDRTSQMGVAATQMALADAALDLEREDRTRIGVMFGTTLGIYDYDYILQNHTLYYNGASPDASSNPEIGLMAFPEACASQMSMEIGARGPSLTFATTCSSALDGIGHALKAIRYGELDLAFAGGSQAPISEPMVSGFTMLRGMSTRNDEPQTASRPFDKTRDGFVMGEGAGIIVVEELEHARERGAHIYAEILGYGLTCDGYHMTNPKPDGRDAARALALAIKDAGIAPEEIDYVSAHGTSTPMNDRTETKVLKTVLGQHAYKAPVSSVKSMIGHLIGAAGSVELIASLIALKEQLLPPTINYHTPDPECDLDYVPNAARPAAIRTILKNSFGFGGKNSALVVRALD
jgi:3-oxoacyl-[acyl-carrier-protein] synthase II